MVPDAERTFTVRARLLGVVAAAACVVLTVAYAITLVAGLLSLPSAEVPIGDPYFTLLEILIIALVLPMVALMSAVHDSAPADMKVFTRLALVFMGMLAVITGCVHFVILTVGHAAAASGERGMTFLFNFAWPSVAYALEILAWDVFFALAVLFAAPAFHGRGLAALTRTLLRVSGTLALAGVVAVPLHDMRWRFLGIAGYVIVFPVAVACIGLLFHRASPAHVTEAHLAVDHAAKPLGRNP